MLQMMKKQIFNSFGLSTLQEYGKENEFQINLIVKDVVFICNYIILIRLKFHFSVSYSV